MLLFASPVILLYTTVSYRKTVVPFGVIVPVFPAGTYQHYSGTITSCLVGKSFRTLGWVVLNSYLITLVLSRIVRMPSIHHESTKTLF